jgi:hypothetical protein
VVRVGRVGHGLHALEHLGRQVGGWVGGWVGR